MVDESLLQMLSGSREMIGPVAGSLLLLVGLVALHRALRSLLRRLAGRLGPRGPRLEVPARRIVALVLGTSAVLILAYIWGLAPALFGVAGPASVAAAVALVVLATWFGWYAANLAVQILVLRTVPRRAPVSARRQTVAAIAVGVMRAIIVFNGFLLATAELELDIRPLLAGPGLAGLALAFGAQSLVKDFFGGIMILSEDTLSVGDIAVAAGHTGKVERLGLRTLSLRDAAGIVYTIPYSRIGTIENFSKDFAYALLDIRVAYREDIKAVMQLIERVAEEMRADPELAPRILAPLEMLGVDRFADGAVILRVRLKTKAGEHRTVARALRRRLKIAFDAHGIEIARPHRTIYFGTGKGKPPPMGAELRS